MVLRISAPVVSYVVLPPNTCHTSSGQKVPLLALRCFANVVGVFGSSLIPGGPAGGMPAGGRIPWFFCSRWFGISMVLGWWLAIEMRLLWQMPQKPAARCLHKTFSRSSEYSFKPASLWVKLGTPKTIIFAQETTTVAIELGDIPPIARHGWCLSQACSRRCLHYLNVLGPDNFPSISKPFGSICSNQKWITRN